MTDIELLKTSLKSAMAVYQNVLDNETDCITNIATKLGDILEAGGTIYLCGNGGSAADAQHLAAELLSKSFERPIGVDVSFHQNAGASNIQQLAFALAKSKDLVEKLGAEIL